jgi:FMN reductase (NADPH)
MSTPTIELIHKHGSARSYKSDPVPEAWIEEIISSGQRASTSSNLQTYSVIVTTDQQKKDQVSVISGGQKHIAQAPLFLLWCADFSRLKRVCDHQGYVIESGGVENFMVAVVDAAIAMQNAALAAQSKGLGFCYIGAVRNDPRKMRTIFSLPDLVYPVCGMTLGWPEKTPIIRPRLPLGAIMHWDEYNEDDQAYLLEYDKAMIQTGIYSGRQVDRDDQDPGEYGWMEHSARRVTKPSRPHLRETIIESGFEIK